MIENHIKNMKDTPEPLTVQKRSSAPGSLSTSAKCFHMVELRHLSVWVPAHLHFNILDWHNSVIYVFLSQTQTATAGKKHENEDFSFRIKGQQNRHCLLDHHQNNSTFLWCYSSGSIIVFKIDTIYSFIHVLYLLLLHSGVTGCWSLSQLPSGKDGGHRLHKLPV